MAIRLFCLATTKAAEGRRVFPTLRSCRPFIEARVARELRRPRLTPATRTAFLAVLPVAEVLVAFESLPLPVFDCRDPLVTICLADRNFVTDFATACFESSF